MPPAQENWGMDMGGWMCV
ncbi:unnamed protein product, partial [Rotaria sp. Silwood1]